VSVSERDVRHIAALARLGLEPERVPELVRELNGILAHMDVLSRVKTSLVEPVVGVGAGGMPLRADDGAPYALARPREDFAPEMRDGFFLVPRLATHVSTQDAGDGASAEDLA
jgi:aspartyl-tRNA(Asn)/glutamyl-tRNA(Gln) amidotransferase subunit C